MDVDRIGLLLTASTALARTNTLAEVVTAVRHLVVGVPDPAFVDITLVDGRRRPAGEHPAAAVIRSGQPLLLADLDQVARHTPDAFDRFTAMGWKSAAAIPLPGPDGPVGALVFVWAEPTVLVDADRAVLAALAGYVALALQRARVLDDRRNAAATLQKALLTRLPEDAGIRLAARYVPAHHEDQVGGDWYDAVRLGPDRLALIIGDVTGHDLDAAATMSEYRSMLRVLAIDRDEPPSEVLRRLETAALRLGTPRFTSVLLAHLDREPAGGHTLSWANAGHPAPMLRLPDGAVEHLADRRQDPLIGYGTRAPRLDHLRHLPPGSLLLMHTDGLVEDRAVPIDEGLARVRDQLAGCAGLDVQEVADLLIAGSAGATAGREDDAALLVVQT
ncbi:hypothetical protein GCM10010172_81810 [Paractinoplanes ferrugineus]|uniref:Serine phosphatase RsbU (Regulator of sigma subunit) n=1 Tax=Paractinoplanes ferrugineus TaxID=113564 RepID=A0A919MJT9_9ACTN|nr:GAF domain-containing SpoIIE family protein phosphatase [Actinoplanes ferrugineus]GIE10502.1 hypothetical protein Afe05nite_23420 [Actinoplanes ferrugineus]